MNRQKTIADLVKIGMVEMKPTGNWGLATSGREFLDQLDLMRELDDRTRSANFGSIGDSRPGARQSSSPLAAGSDRRTDRDGDAPTDRAAGGMNPATREARSKGTRS